MRFQTAFVHASELVKRLVSFPPNIRSPFPCSKVDEDLVKNSGKFLLLDRMLPELKKRGHKVKLKIIGKMRYTHLLMNKKMLLRNLSGFVGLVVLTNDYDA